MCEPSFYQRHGKRALDVVISGGALLGLAVPLTVTAVIVRTRLGSPVLFRQSRPGRFEEEFEILKFRTMTDERDDKDELLPDRERLTPLGRLLRSTSIDELPALVNVLRGDLSLIGPRPLLTRYQSFYREQERVRFTVRPGITGLAQVEGRNTVSWDERLGLDAWYANNYSFTVDMKILLKTITVVFSRTGVAEVPNESMLSLDEERAQHEEP